MSRAIVTVPCTMAGLAMVFPICECWFVFSTKYACYNSRKASKRYISSVYYIPFTFNFTWLSHVCCFVHDFSYMNIVFVYRADVPVRGVFERFRDPQ